MRDSKREEPASAPAVRRPTAKAAARRLLVLRYVVAYSIILAPNDFLESVVETWEAKARDDYWRTLKDHGLWRYVSPNEREYATSPPESVTPEWRFNMGWRVESLLTLIWALGFLPDLPPYDTWMSFDLSEVCPTVETKGFIEEARLRPRKEIEDAWDSAELWHWRSRTRDLIGTDVGAQMEAKLRACGIDGLDHVVRITAVKSHEQGSIPPCVDEDFPAFGKAYRDLSDEDWSLVHSVTIERHFALNWLCGYAPGNRWDETPTDT